MDVAIYADHAKPEIAAIAGKFLASGARIHWRGAHHYTEGESEHMDLVIVSPDHPRADLIVAEHAKRNVVCESTAAHVAKVPQESKSDVKTERKKA